MMPFSELDVDLQFLCIHTPCRSALDRYPCCTCDVFHLDYRSVCVWGVCTVSPRINTALDSNREIIGCRGSNMPTIGLCWRGTVYGALLVSD